MALSVSGVVPTPLARARRQIWSVGGGKGGIGKSILTASLGWQLARMGKRVVLVDADLGGANLHTCLGLPNPEHTLGDFIQRRRDTIEEVLVDTGTPGLRLISGASDFLGAANIKHAQKVRVLNRIKALAAGSVPDDIACVGERKASARDVFFYVISGHKVHNPAAAMQLIERVG